MVARGGREEWKPRIESIGYITVTRGSDTDRIVTGDHGCTAGDVRQVTVTSLAGQFPTFLVGQLKKKKKKRQKAK